MWGSLLASLWGCARPEPVQIVVVARWAGASSTEIEQEVGLPLEEALRDLPGAQGLLVQSYPGHVQLQVSLPASSAEQLAGALDRALLPEGVHPWAYRAFEHTSDWLVPLASARELLPALNAEFGLDSAWSNTLWPEVIEVHLPEGTDLQALLAELPPQLTAVPEPLRAHARSVGSRVSATWDGAPVALLHVGKPEKQVKRWFSERQVQAVAVPTERVMHLQAWDRPAEALVQELKAQGAEHLLVISGRPLPGGQPEPGRVEIVAQWPGKVPVLGLPEAQLSLPSRTTWEVEIDAERARSLGVEPAAVAAALRLATMGHPLKTEDGTILELKVGETAPGLEALSALMVGEGVRLRDVAQLVQVEEPRERVRLDGQPVEGAVLLSREPVVRYPW